MITIYNSEITSLTAFKSEFSELINDSPLKIKFENIFQNDLCSLLPDANLCTNLDETK